MNLDMLGLTKERLSPVKPGGADCYEKSFDNKLELGEDCDGGSCCTNECKLKATAHCNYETYSFASGVKVTTTNECCTSYCKPR